MIQLPLSPHPVFYSRDVANQEVSQSTPAFGHLNQRWKDFTSSHSADDELWAFTANWETDWGGKELRKGYVFVRNSALGAHFLTTRTTLSAE